MRHSQPDAVREVHAVSGHLEVPLPADHDARDAEDARLEAAAPAEPASAARGGRDALAAAADPLPVHLGDALLLCGEFRSQGKLVSSLDDLNSTIDLMNLFENPIFYITFHH